jgi:hypothetical protein
VLARQISLMGSRSRRSCALGEASTRADTVAESQVDAIASSNCNRNTVLRDINAGGRVRRTPTTRDRLRYRFDHYMSRGGRSAFLGLVVIFLLFLTAVLLLRFVLSLFLPTGAGGADRGAVENAFVAFLEISDPGSMAEDLSSSRWFMVAAMIAGVGGVILVSALIAFMTTALDARLSKLRRGHSQVVEEGHTLILGWEEQRVVEIIRELAIANESERRKAVVILADRDKEYMDDYLALQLPDTKTTRVITRSGSPASLVNLDVVSAATAKSAIVLAECSEAATSREKAESDARRQSTPRFGGRSVEQSPDQCCRRTVRRRSSFHV